MLEKGWNPRLTGDTLRKDLIDIHPKASSFKVMLDKAKHHAKQSMNDTFEYAKQKWDKSHKVPDFKVGDLVRVQAELSGKLENKHPTFPVSLVKPYQQTDKELFPLRNQTPFTVQPVEQDEEKS
ncbi:hypothetical protein O181_075584 [Austropuccinia psidii MF-1]|uniref:Uncharacterized protein n=1 Tax=Austropuccinia psidii MF-1 TaxID=1389203 RepID=A0A9Q3IEL5_9BASI|nr:hypothetical protein [Austropuccinia psidii MF-1]